MSDRLEKADIIYSPGISLSASSISFRLSRNVVSRAELGELVNNSPESRERDISNLVRCGHVYVFVMLCFVG